MIYIVIILSSIFILWKINIMSTIVEKIRSEVEKNTAVVQSVITLVTNMAEQIRATQAD